MNLENKMDKLKQFWRSRSNRWQVFGVTLEANQEWVELSNDGD